MAIEDRTPSSAVEEAVSRFELAPPRRFILPAILLLLSERPGYGYGLVPGLQELRFGHVDRPAVYRALAQLEADGLVEASSQSLRTGQARRVYRVTGLGERVLRGWMGVIREEQECLGRVLRRYQATGTTDAVLAEVEGGWATAFGWSPVSSTSTGRPRLTPVTSPHGDPDPGDPGRGDQGSRPAGARATGTGDAQRFRLVADRSVVLIEVRSSAGPLSFGAVGVTGWVTAALVDGGLSSERAPEGRIEIDVSGLRSGNRVYDAELLRRIDARRFPTAAVVLRSCEESGSGRLYRLQGEVTFHGATRPAHGTVNLEIPSDRRMVITGEQVFDIRDFAIPSPTVLMLRIYPDVRVRLHAEAELERT